MKELFLEVFSDISIDGMCFVPLETVIVLFFYEYLNKPPVNIIFVLSSGGENRYHFAIQIPNVIFEVLDEGDVEVPGNLCKLPSFVYDSSCTAGLCSVLRQMVRIVNEKHELLGYKQGCLSACAESSIWTKFCEVDIIESVNNLFLEGNEVREIPHDVARFEVHMGKPVKAHNIQKLKQDQAKKNGNSYNSRLPDSRLDTIQDLDHIYSEGHQMSLADLILFPCFHLAFQALGSPFVQRLLPLTYKWYSNLLKKEKFEQAVTLLPELKSWNHDILLLLPETSDISLYKGEWRNSRRKKRSYTKQNNVDCSLEIIKELDTKEICTSRRAFGYDVNFDWPKLFFEKNEFPKERYVRKIQQLENLIKAVLKIAKSGDQIVDFCSGCGYLGLILAHCLPECRIILLENKEASLERARQLANAMNLTNTIFCQGNIDYFRGDFNIGVSLHACGVATDLVMEICLRKKASFVCCPCCYGSIQPNHMVCYPRSERFRNSPLTIEDYLTLAHSSDQTHSEKDPKTGQGKKCMTIIDTDRCLNAKENGYHVHLSTLEPPSCTPKNNLLVGISNSNRMYD